MKLWIVSITREAYVLAESEEAALALQNQIERWEDPIAKAEPWAGRQLDGYSDSFLVYTHDKRDLTLAEAKRIDAETP